MPWGMFASECAEYAQRPFHIAMVTMLFSSTLTENALRHIFVFFCVRTNSVPQNDPLYRFQPTRTENENCQ